MIFKLISKIHTRYVRWFNNKYYLFPNISNSVIFSPEYPGRIFLQNPKNIIIGEKTVINRGAHINPGEAKVSIGDYCHIGKDLTIYAFNHNYESNRFIPYDEINILKNVTINNYVWIGANVVIIPGVTIGEGAVIGAGSVITKDIPDCAVVAGNPSKIIKYRDIELFNELKNKKKFY